MVLVLSFIGLLMAIWTWENVHPLAGIAVGFLFVGGAGWGMLGAFVSLGKPAGREARGPAGRQFIRAWEHRTGEMRPGQDNRPPPGAFRQWLDEYKQTGIEAGEWIDERLLMNARAETPPRPKHVEQEVWARVRLRPDAPIPGAVTLTELGQLYTEFAYIAASNPLLPTEAKRQSEILVALHERGARVDAEWLRQLLENQGIEEGEFSTPRTQEALDDWQQRAVQGSKP